jgi:hypothetical protein
MRPQITTYLSSETKVWLTRYAAQFGLRESEVVRLLVERERHIGWLKRVISVPDEGEG